MQELYNNSFNILNERIWKVAIYVRLSREDEKDECYKGQSESIENQIKYLKTIVNEKEWTLVDIYKDDGYTGTNFDRPDFKRMINDINIGKINLVITKDLSRLGRDYIETGKYIEKIFPSKNIRYIAVNDNVDTFDKKNSNNDITPFKAVINDMYAKDTSNKVRSTILTKAMNGECIKAFLPYGYKKDKINKNKILIDENVSENVKLIFNLYKSGKSKTEIAKTLNKLDVPTPLKYKYENTNYYNPNSNSPYKWNSTIINKILRNQIYVGDLVQLKYNKVNYKVKKILKVPKEEQVVIMDNHQAIINRDVFNTVQEMLDKQTNEWNYSSKKRHLLTGLVFCKCGCRITYNKNHGKFFRCVCSGYKKYGKEFCSNIHLKEAELLEMVAGSLKKNIDKYLNFKRLNFPLISMENNNSQELIKLSKKKDEINKIIASLYEDKISKIISTETFEILMTKYENQKKELDIRISALHREKTNLCNLEMNNYKMEANIKKLLNFESINEKNKGLVFKLIDKIIIDNDTIIIKYKFNKNKQLFLANDSSKI